MLSLFNRKRPITVSEKERLDTHFFNMFSASNLHTQLPFVNKEFNSALQTIYPKLREAERCMIFRRTLGPGGVKAEKLDKFHYERLAGGYSNKTYKVKTDEKSAYISRLPGKGLEGIDRAAESHNVLIAHELGLAPKVFYSDKKGGDQLTECLDKPSVVDPELLKREPRYLREIAQLLKKLHGSSKSFAKDVNIFKNNQDYMTLISSKGLAMPDEYKPIGLMAHKLKEIFAELPIKFVPCHNDVYCNNFLKSNERLWLIDWETSGNHDAAWDLAYFACLTNLSADQINIFLTEYFGTPHYQKEFSLEYDRFMAYQLIVYDFNVLWSHAQLAIKNDTVPKEDYIKWANLGLTKGLAVLKDPVFLESVENLQRGSSVRLSSRGSRQGGQVFV